jgi:uncharacterized protein YbaR (Trm112 family)
MIADNFLAILACPICTKSVTRTDDGSYLVCTDCKLSFPVKEGIAVMLAGEALQHGVADQ